MKTRYKILIAILVLAIAGLITVYLYVFRTGQPDMFRLKTDYRIEATALYKEFEADEQAATDKFAGKILEVSGSVESIEKNEWGHVTIAFIDPVFGVTCTIDSLQAMSQPEVVTALKSGDLIIIKGRCDGMLTDVKLVKCVLVTGNQKW
ncbi:MAG: hypothetical protein V2A67_05185 [Bacteroidota bacterium]